ncbi:hypothetical protein [Bradyrhizobium sp. sGM-13]|uniref:hypothetical protein n=1 Tax=Bradyrhizobium sp. sGM-13 TaxID=2831781 RepID=UPI001BCEBEAC|nr:hypothetical protein [Bradyrhizobium sp. sGM-13]
MSRTSKSKSAAFKAGFAACAFLGFGAVSYGGDLLLKEFRPDLEKAAVESAKNWVKETFFEENLFSKDGYISLRYADGRGGYTYQTLRLSLKGRSRPHGEIEDLSNGNKAVVKGYWRASMLVLTYASAAPDRPGIGSFILRPMLPGLAEKSVAYAGCALVHEWGCDFGADTFSDKLNGPMRIVPAILTSERIPSEGMKKALFVKDPMQPGIVGPADLQKKTAYVLF